MQLRVDYSASKYLIREFVEIPVVKDVNGEERINSALEYFRSLMHFLRSSTGT